MSLFVFDKSQLDKVPKATRNAVLEVLRLEVRDPPVSVMAWLSDSC